MGEQRQCFRWRDILNIRHVPIIRQMLPFSEPFSHERPMFRFFDRNREISAGQVVGCTLLREPIGPARGNHHLLKGVQRERRNREQFFGKPATVVVAGAQEEFTFWSKV